MISWNIIAFCYPCNILRPYMGFLKSFRQGKTVIIFLTLFVASICLLPLLISPTNIFYNIDPKTSYIGNAIQFLETGKMAYYGHPGTPAILIISALLLPIKLLYSSFHWNFPLWVVANYNFIFWLGRSFFFLFFISGYFLIHLIIYKKFRSVLVNLFLFSLFFLDPSFQGISTRIAGEPLSFFIFAPWLYLFLTYLKYKNINNLYALAFLSGLLVANKFVYIFFPVSVLILIFFHQQGLLNNKINLLLKGAGNFFAGFFISTLPIWVNYKKIFQWLFGLLTRTGTYGEGKAGFIDPKLFINAAGYWYNQRLGLAILLALTLIGILVMKTRKEWKIITMVGLIGFVTFLKYPVARYQTGNLLILFTSAVYLFSKLGKRMQIFILILISTFSTIYIYKDIIYRRILIVKAADLQQFVSNIPPETNVIWEYGESEDFALKRAKGDSGTVFISPMKIVKPHTFELVWQTLTQFKDNGGEIFSLRECNWDGMIIQGIVFDSFSQKQENTSFFIKEKIPGTEMLYLKHINCSERGI